MNREAKIFVAGHNGMVGRAIVRKLVADGFSSIVTRERADLDLLDQQEVRSFFETERPEAVVLAAAKVGGIVANNTYPAQFLAENLSIQLNVIDSAYRSGCQKLLFLGSSCIYPKFAEQPMRENALLTGVLEATNEPYAIAKIAGIKLCESYNRQYGTDYRSIMPTNLYGPFDNFHPENSHVIPALVRRIHEAKLAELPEVVIWGTGTPKREFLHVDDMAAASVFLLDSDRDTLALHTEPMMGHVNAGTGQDISILDLALLIKEVVGYQGTIGTDPTKPDGTPRKLMDTALINRLGWKPAITLKDGLCSTYEWYLQHQDVLREA